MFFTRSTCASAVLVHLRAPVRTSTNHHGCFNKTHFIPHTDYKTFPTLITKPATQRSDCLSSLQLLRTSPQVPTRPYGMSQNSVTRCRTVSHYVTTMLLITHRALSDTGLLGHMAVCPFGRTAYGLPTTHSVSPVTFLPKVPQKIT